jgi:hypothetical protein
MDKEFDEKYYLELQRKVQQNIMDFLLPYMEKITASSGDGLRDYFACSAMQGFAAAGCFRPQSKSDIDVFTTEAYRIADAMLEARSTK